MKIHHIGYLVKDIKRAQPHFEQLGFRAVNVPVFDCARKVNILFMDNADSVIELVSPASPDSVVSTLIKRYRNTPYHICYTADNFEWEVDMLCAGGFTQIEAPAPAPAINGKKVVFLMSPHIGLVELLEE